MWRLIGRGPQAAQRMVLRKSLLGAYVTKHIQLLLDFSTHAFFSSGRVVEARELSGTRLPF
jgi:hypothetical protein